jgi:uncharacterized protein YbaP (TraB family)
VQILIKKIIQSLFFSFCLIAYAAASEDKAFFWKVESGTATVYMFGSIHFADESFYPLRDEIEQAFRNSEHLVVELDAESISAEEYQRQVAEKGSYAGADTIENHVSRDTLQKLSSYLKKMGVPIKAVEKQKPGMMVLTLTALEVMRLGLDPKLGIDLHFLNQARSDTTGRNKKILELETLDEQFAIFLNFPDGELLLEETFYSINESEGLVDEMVTIWKQGDEKKMNELLFEDAVRDYPGFASIYESLFYSRNVKMANAIQSYLEKRGRYFVVVGAGHLVGEKGIIRLLEKGGYEVGRL